MTLDTPSGNAVVSFWMCPVAMFEEEEEEEE
jgi:hypothetical protein